MLIKIRGVDSLWEDSVNEKTGKKKITPPFFISF